MASAKGLLGLATPLSSSLQGDMHLLLQMSRDKMYKERMAQDEARKIQEFNRKVYENDMPRGFQFTDAELQKDFNTNVVAPVMEQWTQEYKDANMQGRRLTPEAMGKMKMVREGLANKKAQASELVRNLNEAAKIIKDDKYSIYPDTLGPELMSTVARNENGDIDWERLDPKAPLNVIGNPDNMSLTGLARMFRDDLEENVITEIQNEWQDGQLHERKNIIKYQGALLLDNDGNPVRTDDGQVIPLVDPKTMAIIKRTMPRLYFKLEKEEERTGKSKQDIMRETLQSIGGVEERSSRKVLQSPATKTGKTPQDEAKSFGSTRSTNIVFSPDSRTQYVGDEQLQAPITSSASYSIGTSSGKPKSLTVAPSSFVDLATGEATSRNTDSFELQASEILFLPVARGGNVPIKFNSEEELFSFLSKASPENYSMRWFVKGRAKMAAPEKKKSTAQKITSLLDFARSQSEENQKKEEDKPGLRDILVPADQVHGALKQATGGRFDLTDAERPSRELEEKVLNLIGSGKRPVAQQPFPYDNF